MSQREEQKRLAKKIIQYIKESGGGVTAEQVTEEVCDLSRGSLKYYLTTSIVPMLTALVQVGELGRDVPPHGDWLYYID